MADRVLSTNAYTTLDLVDAEAEGHGWLAEALAVANVTDDGDRVALEVELDNTELDLDAHADRLRLDPVEARELAAELERHADRVDAE